MEEAGGGAIVENPGIGPGAAADPEDQRSRLLGVVEGAASEPDGHSQGDFGGEDGLIGEPFMHDPEANAPAAEGLIELGMSRGNLGNVLAGRSGDRLGKAAEGLGIGLRKGR